MRFMAFKLTVNADTFSDVAAPGINININLFYITKLIKLLFKMLCRSFRLNFLAREKSAPSA